MTIGFRDRLIGVGASVVAFLGAALGRAERCL